MLWRCRRAARGTETLAHRSGLRSPSPSASFPVLRQCIGSGCGRAERGVRPRGLVYPERDGAANVEAVISVVLDEFHVRPPLTYRLAQGHGLVDEGHRRGNSPFGAPVVDLDGARPDHDTPRHADSTGDADTCSRLHQATLLFGPTVLEVERRSHRASSNGYRDNLSSTPGSPTRSGFTLLSFPRCPVIAPAPGPTTPGPGASDPV